MSIFENDFTRAISVLAVLNDNSILIGQESGRISLWEYSRPKQLRYVRSYEGDGFKITKIIPNLWNSFISINEKGEIRIWEINSGICQRVLDSMFRFSTPEAVVLLNNLLVVLAYSSPAWSCFDVWDLESERLIYQGKDMNHRPHMLHLNTTAQGLVLVASYYSVSLWKINRTECKMVNQIDISTIYSMAVLPTGEFVIGNHDLRVYKISSDGGIYPSKTLDNGNVIDTLYSVGGYKLLTVDRSGACSGTIKLWNCISEKREVLGNSLFGGFLRTSEFHVILEKKGTVLSHFANRILIHEFSEDIFRFPSELAEVRKNARVLSQAHRTGTGFFSKLPMEVNLRITSFTFESKDEFENAVSEDLAQNYFCRPMICDE